MPKKTRKRRHVGNPRDSTVDEHVNESSDVDASCLYFDTEIERTIDSTAMAVATDQVVASTGEVNTIDNCVTTHTSTNTVLYYWHERVCKVDRTYTCEKVCKVPFLVKNGTHSYNSTAIYSQSGTDNQFETNSQSRTGRNNNTETLVTYEQTSWNCPLCESPYSSAEGTVPDILSMSSRKVLDAALGCTLNTVSSSSALSYEDKSDSTQTAQVSQGEVDVSSRTVEKSGALLETPVSNKLFATRENNAKTLMCLKSAQGLWEHLSTQHTDMYARAMVDGESMLHISIRDRQPTDPTACSALIKDAVSLTKLPRQMYYNSQDFQPLSVASWLLDDDHVPVDTDQWRRPILEADMNEFDDVSCEEKRLFNLWNQHIDANNLIPIFDLPSRLDQFVRAYGPKIHLQSLELTLVTHLTNLWHEGYIGRSQFLQLMATYHYVVANNDAKVTSKMNKL